MEDYQLSAYDAGQLCEDKITSDFFLELVKDTKLYKASANWMLGPLRSYCNEKSIDLEHFPLSPSSLASLIRFTEEGLVSFNVASGKLMTALITDPSADLHQLASGLGILQESGGKQLENWVDEVLGRMPAEVKAYRSGKKNLLGLFAGEVKKQSGGKADMQKVTGLIKQKLADL